MVRQRSEPNHRGPLVGCLLQLLCRVSGWAGARMARWQHDTSGVVWCLACACEGRRQIRLGLAIRLSFPEWDQASCLGFWATDEEQAGGLHGLACHRIVGCRVDGIGSSLST